MIKKYLGGENMKDLLFELKLDVNQWVDREFNFMI
jgi:hypothetical protein